MLQGEKRRTNETEGEARVGRRAFLKTASTAVLGLTAINVVGCETNFVEPLVDGLQIPFITPNEDFFVRVGAEVSIPNWQQPSISAGDWTLTLDGLVDSPVTITYADLVEEAANGNAVTLLKTMRCVVDTNEVEGLIGTALWTGIPLDVFTDRAGVRPEARRFRVYGYDGFTNNFRIDRVKGNEQSQLFPPILVTHMNGQLLPEIHGGPVRLILSESFGYKNLKWLERIEAVASDDPFGTYQDVGFIDDGELRIVSKITDPIGNGMVQAGATRVFGIAVSGASPISRVEVSIDGSQWADASIVSLDEIVEAAPELESALQLQSGLAYPFRSVWVQWFFDVNLAAGDHEIRVRAIDVSGNEQPDTDLDISDSVNAIPSVTVTAV
ncbi:MAG: molybdopterin-dependent oxidoreductase [Rhodothermales bacterium]|nr:molybdopterin-dependent oxidoreductase [Rhodothermales bacterium]